MTTPSMVERVAEVVAAVHLPLYRDDGAIFGVQTIPHHLANEVARVAIAAMREASKGMTDAALEALNDGRGAYIEADDLRDAYTAMIDQALAETPA